MYNPPLRSDEIYHFGIKRRSGRYPWGSGERPYQGEDVKRLRDQQKLAVKSKKTEELADRNLKIGRERLENRIRVANIETDRYSRKIGWQNTEKAGEANKRVSEIKKATNEILSDDERTRILGDYTRKSRNIIVGSTAIGSVAAYGSTAAFLASVLGASAPAVLAIPLTPAAIAAYAGYSYYQHTKY